MSPCLLLARAFRILRLNANRFGGLYFRPDPSANVFSHFFFCSLPLTSLRLIISFKIKWYLIVGADGEGNGVDMVLSFVVVWMWSLEIEGCITPACWKISMMSFQAHFLAESHHGPEYNVFIGVHSQIPQPSLPLKDKLQYVRLSCVLVSMESRGKSRMLGTSPLDADNENWALVCDPQFSYGKMGIFILLVSHFLSTLDCKVFGKGSGFQNGYKQMSTLGCHKYFYGGIKPEQRDILAICHATNS